MNTNRKSVPVPAASTPEQRKAADLSRFAADERMAWAELDGIVETLERYAAEIKRSVARRDRDVEWVAARITNDLQNLTQNLQLPRLMSYVADAARSRGRIERYAETAEEV